MAILAYDYNMIAAPELLVPGEKPVSPVELGNIPIDWLWLFDNIAGAHSIGSNGGYASRNNRAGADITQGEYGGVYLPGEDSASSTADYYDLPSEVQPGSGDFSILCKARLPSGNSLVSGIFGRGAGSNAESGWCIRASNTGIQCVVGNGASRVAVSWTQPVFVTETLTLIMTVKRGGNLRLFSGGKVVASTSVSGLSGSYSAGSNATLGYHSIFAGQAPMHLHYAGYCGYALSDSLAIAITSDPYLIVKAI
jgi:hypothetical protein